MANKGRGMHNVLNVEESAFCRQIDLDEEEIADVSLATFYIFDKETAGTLRFSVRLAGGCENGSSGLFHRKA
jgi:hypothetical protein